MLTEQFKTLLFVFIFAVLIIFGIFLITQERQISTLSDNLKTTDGATSKIITILTPATPSATLTPTPIKSKVKSKTATESAK